MKVGHNVAKNHADEAKLFAIQTKPTRICFIMSKLVEKGDLLIAPVSLQDPNFAQSVVLICEHTPGKGSFGLVLNQPVKANSDLLNEFPYIRDNLFKGGPVNPEILQILHPYGDTVQDSVEIIEGVWLGGDVETLCQGFDSGSLSPEKCRFFLGYSGWSGDQLATEFDMRSWLRTAGDTDLIMHTPPDVMWNRAVRKLAGSNPLYANFPDSPSSN